MNRKNQISLIRHLLCCMFFVLALFATGKVVKAEDDGYIVTFENNGDATGMDYSRYNQTVYKTHPSIVLPTVPDIDGYTILGWTKTQGASVADYEMGRSVRISSDTTFYLVCEKLPVYSVKFNNNNGTSTSSVYTRLNTTAYRGEILTLPTIADASGYETLGWTTTKGKSTADYKMGSQVKVVGNVTFYLVRRKITYCTVTFNNNNGTSTSVVYTRLNQSVQKGSSITLPTIADAAGYETVGWTTAKGQSTPIYKCGTTYTVSSNTSFYLVRKKIVYYTAQFYYQTGATNATFKALTQKVAAGSTISLPSNPTISKYVGTGWSLTKNAATASYTAGRTYRVTKNVVFYAVYKPGVTITYCYNDGSGQYRRDTVAQGQTVVLPGVRNPSGYTMLGWAARYGQTQNPTYQVRESITVTKSMTLYAVMYPHTLEANYTSLAQPNLQKYSKVIFVGDSRTQRLGQKLYQEFGTDFASGVSFIAEGGSGLDWLKSTGYQELMQEVGSGGTATKPIAIIFNHGINDISNCSSYISYMKSLAKVLQAKNCKLFYMSVNPHNYVMNSRVGSEIQVRSFNQSIKSSLCNSTVGYTYINTYNYLINYGYSCDQGTATDTGYDDGLHYSVKTSKRIYQFCINVINNAV